MKDEVKGFPIIDFVGLKPQTRRTHLKQKVVFVMEAINELTKMFSRK